VRRRPSGDLPEGHAERTRAQPDGLNVFNVRAFTAPPAAGSPSSSSTRARITATR
jgi:hypothetical protein